MNFTRKRNYRTSTVGQRKNPKLRPAKTAPRQNLKIQRPEKKDFVANDRQRILTPWNLDQHFRDHNEKSSIQPRIGRRLLQKEKNIQLEVFQNFMDSEEKSNLLIQNVKELEQRIRSLSDSKI